MNGISAIKLPKRPLIAVRPKKAMIVVNEAANTGSAIRFAAVSAANIGGNPRRARKSACSPTTMASSTIMPSVRINAKSEIMLNVMPATYISAIAVNIAVGIPAATQNAVLAFRNKNNNTTTNESGVGIIGGGGSEDSGAEAGATFEFGDDDVDGVTPLDALHEDDPLKVARAYCRAAEVPEWVGEVMMERHNVDVMVRCLAWHRGFANGASCAAARQSACRRLRRALGYVLGF